MGSEERKPPMPGGVGTQQERDRVPTACEAKPWGQGKANDSHLGGHVMEPPRLPGGQWQAHRGYCVEKRMGSYEMTRGHGKA